MSDQDAVGDYPFPNEDAHMEEEEERAAKLIWVGVANSTSWRSTGLSLERGGQQFQVSFKN